jgi:hypothetical protein
LQSEDWKTGVLRIHAGSLFSRLPFWAEATKVEIDGGRMTTNARAKGDGFGQFYAGMERSQIAGLGKPRGNGFVLHNGARRGADIVPHDATGRVLQRRDHCAVVLWRLQNGRPGLQRHHLWGWGEMAAGAVLKVEPLPKLKLHGHNIDRANFDSTGWRSSGDRPFRRLGYTDLRQPPAQAEAPAQDQRQQ